MERDRKFSVVLDTNVLVSAFVFGGNPHKVLELVLRKHIRGVTSSFIISELTEVLLRKFLFEESKALLLEKKIRKYFLLVQPTKRIKVLKDDADNRILEAALQGRCQFIVTGDKELLSLKKYKGIVKVTPAQFLQEIYPFDARA